MAGWAAPRLGEERQGEVLMKLIAIRVEEHFYDALIAAAKKERRSLASLCRNILIDKITRSDNGNDQQRKKR